MKRTQHGVVDFWQGQYDESAVREWAIGVREQLEAESVSIGIIFMTPHFFEQAADILELVRVNAQVPLLVGCSSVSLVVGAYERENLQGISLSLFHFPECDLKAFHYCQHHVELNRGAQPWIERSGVSPEESGGWMTFADPFNIDAEAWLKDWNAAYPGVPLLGGLATGFFPEHRSQVYLNGEVYESGGVAVSFGGGVRLLGMVSQGCTPIGHPWLITRTERNMIVEISGKPACEALVKTIDRLSEMDRDKLRGNLFIGLVVDEYLEEFQRGDFLIRNLIGVDQQKGHIAVGAIPRVGQTVQFQRRDCETAREDLLLSLKRAQENIDGLTVYGGCLAACNGRGSHLFKSPHHDAREISSRISELPALTGFFCNGEFGPVGPKNFLHGYTASLALFVSGKPVVTE
jgi:small ligand-binding sensory domain FIST